uniref:Reverse transcriptase n=1 Tax=Trichogramma kaykai TaxID=54128 RepID=A0ABD2XB93_9HYME
MSAAAKLVLDGPIRSVFPSMEEMVSFWEPILTTPSKELDGVTAVDDRDLQWIADPVSMRELLACEVPLSSAPGPDSITRVVGGPPIECRAGCGTTETAAHVIQGCHRTHGGRILRHDAICRIAVSSLRQLGWSVRQEPHFHTREGLRKPDIVAVKDQVVKVIDAQVISASSSLDDSHRRKVAKYDTPDIRHQVASEYGVENDNISFSSITISWRGIWSAASAASLCELGLSKCLDSITFRALRGSYMNWLRWNKMTTHISGYTGTNSAGRSFRREGIG